MSTTTGTSGNDSWSLTGYYSGTLDGLAGTDTLSLGTLKLSDFNLTQNSDGSIQLDTLSGPSGSKPSHIKLINMETLKYGSTRGSIDLTNYFPKVTSFSPDDGANNVAIDSNIVLTFNKAITKGNGNITLHKDSPSGPILEKFSVAASRLLSVTDKTLTIDPDNDLQANTHYYLTIDAGAIQDTQGHAVLDAGGYDFTTADSSSIPDTTAPLLKDVTPKNAQIDVGTNASITLSFDERVKLGSGGLQIHTESATGGIFETYTASSSNLQIDGNTLIIRPSTYFNANTHYVLTLDGSFIQDLAGNPYAGQLFSYEFTTSELPVPTITIVSHNALTGTSGADVIDGRTQPSIIKLTGLAGDDVYIVDNKSAKIIEAANQGNDTVLSSTSFVLGNNLENIVLTGNSAIDAQGNKLGNTITGNSADNTLDGLLGNDTLSGGEGRDVFRFDTTPGKANVDTIIDFTPGQDMLALSSKLFKKLGASIDISDIWFKASGEAQGHNAFLVYDSNAGTLAYDADGSGAGKAVQIALLGISDHPTLQPSDFLLI